MSRSKAVNVDAQLFAQLRLNAGLAMYVNCAEPTLPYLLSFKKTFCIVQRNHVFCVQFFDLLS